MITSKEIKNILKPLIPDVNAWYTGSLGDGNLEKTITIYPYKGITAALDRVNGKAGYRNQGFTVLIRWTRESENSELKAMQVYDIIHGLPEMIEMHSGIPVFLGTEDGVHEYVINFYLKHKEA